jgi:CDP-diacylglycerol--glycerol-3-phosphate 3-phosphatidyltransferase
VSTDTATRPNTATAVFNVPNQLTTLRLVLAVVLFVVMEFGNYGPATVIFIVAAATDWLDGYWARKYGQVTVVGRIFDPFVDKFIICGTFIFLAATPGSGIVAWMAVVIVGREMLVTALRGYIEQQGGDFSAKFAGKLKMLLQCIAAALSLYTLSLASTPAWLGNLLTVSVWAAVLLTLYSGVEYIIAAIRMVRR